MPAASTMQRGLTQVLGPTRAPCMTTYVYIGTVLPDTTRISSPLVTVHLPAGPDYPQVSINTQIADNRVVSSCEIEATLSEVACATLRNIVQDVASSICDSAAILQGAWTVVTVDSCLNADGSIRARFSNTLPHLKEAFAQCKVTSEDIAQINLHPDGYFLRLALDDLNSGLMEMKFMRSHFYRAVESLRRSICPASLGLTNAQSWETFRAALDIERDQIELFVHHAERHGDYENAVPLIGLEVDRIVDAIADLISRYVRWFKANRITLASTAKA